MDTYPKNKAEVFNQLGGINSKASVYQNGLHEFRDLTNLNFFITGALSKRPGSTLYINATLSGKITGLYEFQRLNGASYVIVAANTNIYTASGGAFSVFNTGLTNNALFEFTTFVDRLFAANGAQFFKYEGTNVTNFSLPPGYTASWGVSLAQVGGGLSGVFQVAYSYVNDRGYIGPPSNGFSISCIGNTFGTITFWGMTSPTGYGISYIQLWRSTPGGLDLYGVTQIPIGGSSFALDSGAALGITLASYHLWFTAIPKYLEIYNNQLFLGGFSGSLSRVYWSEIGEPEGILPTYFSEFRTNDGDRLMGLKAYNGALIAPKQFSFHRVVGDNPTNFSFEEVSTEFGCLSNRSMLVFNNLFMCLDGYGQGIVEYNGANIGLVSTKNVEDIFKRMNVDSAKDQACAVHYKDYNEVWFHIPIDGSTLNNSIVVYDYNVLAWTKYEGVQATQFASARGTLSKKSILYGSYSGALFSFNSSLYGDNGSAITCMIDGVFYAPLGNTTENMFRRFWMNVNPVLGITQAINLSFKTNFQGTTIGHTGVIYQTPYQSRLDFGLSARSIAAKAEHASASLPLRIDGIAWESRYQRSV